MTLELFREIIGQKEAIEFLRQVIANDKIAPAYLFTGIPGVGKRTTAMAFALLLNCTSPVDGDGCKRCGSCKKMIDGNHPDLIVIETDREKRVIGIDQIREINRHLAFSPLLGRYRIIIIDPAEKMSDEAANAFLKTLEEPPPGNILILKVRDPGQLLPTIVSRCQRVSFKPLPTEDIVNWLTKQRSIDGEKARILARLSEGSLGEAIELTDDDLFADRAGLVAMLNTLIDGSPDRLLDMAQRFSDLGKANKEARDDRIALLLGIWKSWFRDMLLIKLGGKLDLILNADLGDQLKRASTSYTADGVMRSISVIARAERDLMDNKNTLLLLERSLIGLRRAANLE